jgi:uncharacterized protein YbcV (DUF1398 family)
MNAKIRDVCIEATNASDQERATFPQIVKMLIDAGVERYHADLVRGEKTYYLPDGASELTKGEPIGVNVARDFSPAAMEAAVRAVQAGKIGYRTFCAMAAQAGCVGYVVSMLGQRVVYYGRTGDSHVEWFPGARREQAA